MKATYKHIAFAALALSAVACSQNDDFAPSYLSDPDAVRITAQVGINDATGGFTRSNPLGTAEEQAKFNNGDQIGVIGGAQAAVTYTYDDTTWNPGTDEYLKWESDKMSFTAWYPVGKNDASATTFTVPTTGYTSLADLADADYMTYSGEQTKGTDNSISLTMERKMVRIVIDQINFNNQFETGYSVTGIKVHANTKGYADGAPAIGNIEVTACQHDGAFYALLTPTNEALNETFLTVTVAHNTDATDVHTLYVKAIPATTAGKSYSLTLTVGKDVATIGSVSITPWTGGTIPGGVAKEDLHEDHVNGICTVCGRKLYDYDATTNTATVSTAEGLLAWNKAVQADLTLNLTLAEDITLTGENNWIAIQEYDDFIHDGLAYTGTIDGASHTITGLHISSTSDYLGFVNCLGEGGSIKDLTFANAQVTGGQYLGIVASINYGTIENCHVTSGTLTATEGYAGGIVYSNLGTVIGCTNAAAVAEAEGSTNGYVGGIACENTKNATLIGCINTGTVSGDGAVGGVVGYNYAGIVVACGNTSTVTANNFVGGLIGCSMGEMFGEGTAIGSWTIDTYEYDDTAEVTENEDGIGYADADYSIITDCYSGDAATINAKVEAMNTAIGTTYGYTWQAGTDGEYPTLVKATE